MKGGDNMKGCLGHEIKNIPFFMDFAFELPEGVEIESNLHARDTITWGIPPIPSDDD